MENTQSINYKLMRKSELNLPDLVRLALLYKDIFKPFPWNYDCSVSRAKKDLLLVLRYRRKEIIELQVEDHLAGFSLMVERIKAKKFSNGKEVKGWYLADLGIINKYHGIGFGSVLLKANIDILKEFNATYFFFKTLNESMVRLAEKFAEISVISEVEEFKRSNYRYYLAKIQ